MTTPVVTFDYATWVGMFPEFSGCSAGQGQGFFNRACLQFANDTCNPAFSAGNMQTLFYLLTSHIAWISAPRDANGNPAQTGQPSSPLVGRVSSAAEGSVNVASEWNTSGQPNEAYYTQTTYGAEFWTAMAVFRTAQYLAMPTFVPSAIFPFGFGGAGFGRRFR